MRVPFTIADQAALDEIGRLTLNMKYDDGFVAYLNGVRVASHNDPVDLDWESGATTGHPDAEAIEFVPFPLDSTAVNALQTGENVLAIHALNNGKGSSDLLVLPQLLASAGGAAPISPGAREYDGSIALTGPVQPRARVYQNGEWSALTTAPFYVATVPADSTNLAISEIHYHPANDNNAEEYVELMNIGDQPIDLRGVRFVDGLRFEFVETADYELAALAPGERGLAGRPSGGIRGLAR